MTQGPSLWNAYVRAVRNRIQSLNGQGADPDFINSEFKRFMGYDLFPADILASGQPAAPSTIPTAPQATSSGGVSPAYANDAISSDVLFGIDDLGGLSSAAKLAGKGLFALGTLLGKGTADIAKSGMRFSEDAAALVDLAKDAKVRGGLTVNQAQAMLDWAKEYGVKPSLNHIGGKPHWVDPSTGITDHIRIGPVNHIPVK